MDSKKTAKGNIARKPSPSRMSSSASSRKYGAHAGLKFNFNLKKNSVTKPVITGSKSEEKKENDVVTITKQLVGKQTCKESTFSGTGDLVTTVRDDVKVDIMKNSIKRTQTTKDIQKDSKIFLEHEDIDLCSNIPKLLRVLQPHPVASNVPKSYTDNKLKPKGVTSNVSNLPSLNDPHVSKGRPSELEKEKKLVTETKSEITIKKYGAHAGLKFPLNQKKIISGETCSFIKKTSVSKTYCSKIEKKSTQRKETTTNGENLLGK